MPDNDDQTVAGGPTRLKARADQRAANAAALEFRPHRQGREGQSRDRKTWRFNGYGSKKDMPNNTAIKLRDQRQAGVVFRRGPESLDEIGLPGLTEGGNEKETDGGVVPRAFHAKDGSHANSIRTGLGGPPLRTVGETNSPQHPLLPRIAPNAAPFYRTLKYFACRWWTISAVVDCSGSS